MRGVQVARMGTFSTVHGCGDRKERTYPSPYALVWPQPSPLVEATLPSHLSHISRFCCGGANIFEISEFRRGRELPTSAMTMMSADADVRRNLT